MNLKKEAASLESILGSLDATSIDAAQKCSRGVSEQYNRLGYVNNVQLNMIAYDDLA